MRSSVWENGPFGGTNVSGRTRKSWCRGSSTFNPNALSRSRRNGEGAREDGSLGHSRYWCGHWTSRSNDPIHREYAIGQRHLDEHCRHTNQCAASWQLWRISDSTHSHYCHRKWFFDTICAIGSRWPNGKILLGTDAGRSDWHCIWDIFRRSRKWRWRCKANWYFPHAIDRFLWCIAIASLWRTGFPIHS